MSKVRTCLWFDGQGEAAARFYVSLLPNSSLGDIFRSDAASPPLVVNFTLDGVPYMALNGGPHYVLNEAASIIVTTSDQVETDRLWNTLLSGGGKENRCGWLKDRFGLSWQIVPEALPRLLMDKDRAASGRAMQAMFGMTKIDIAALEAAFAGK